MSLKARVTADMHAAMRAGEKDRLSLIRMIQAAIQQREVDERIELTDADVLTIIDKMIKQRRDSITQFEAGKREDLAAFERAGARRNHRRGGRCCGAGSSGAVLLLRSRGPGAAGRRVGPCTVGPLGRADRSRRRRRLRLPAPARRRSAGRDDLRVR